MAGIPVCWGNYAGPHVHDVPLRDIVDLVLRVRAGAYSVEAANPRHAHEWQVWEGVQLPRGTVLIPGVIDSTTNFVEHPEVVAQRIERYAGLVGRENVIAGTDCGFGTAAGSAWVHPEIVWAKLAALAEGARLATTRLWGRSSRSTLPWQLPGARERTVAEAGDTATRADPLRHRCWPHMPAALPHPGWRRSSSRSSAAPPRARSTGYLGPAGWSRAAPVHRTR